MLRKKAEAAFRLVSNWSQTRAGKTLTCNRAGTEKLFRAKTNTNSEAWRSDALAAGHRKKRNSGSPARSGSLSNCAASIRLHAFKANPKKIGHKNNVRTQIAPAIE